jgi:hypothetical protein
LLDAVDKQAADHVELGVASDLPAFLRGLEDSGLGTLGVDTEDLPDALVWLWEVVATVAGHSPSVAFSLASRYCADRAAVTSGLTSVVPGTRAAAPAKIDASGVVDLVVPELFSPDWVLALEPGGGRFVASAKGSVRHRPRTGLVQAQLADISLAGDQEGPTVDASAFREWSTLVSAVGVGIAAGALEAAERYSADRVQFGAPIASFAGLRALLASMYERTAAARALGLAAAAEDAAAELGPSAADVAGRAALSVSLDAVQVHGGYGYMDEYPVASRVRDAVSLRARTGQRGALSAIASARLATTTSAGQA